MKKIKVMLADSDENNRSRIRTLLEQDHSIDIAAEAVSGQEVFEKINNAEPEIVIIDIDKPVLNGMEISRQITIRYPDVFVIIISSSNDINNMKEAMLAGAKEYLLNPLLPEDINSTIRKVAELNRQRASLKDKNKDKAVQFINKTKQSTHKVVCIYGTKGGVGKSIICTNLAVAAAHRYKDSITLIDLDLQFGDTSVMLDLNPRKTIAELIQEGENLNGEMLEGYLYERHGVNILAAPNQPELSDIVTTDGVEKIIKLCRDKYAYTFIDTPSFIDENTLSGLELSDLILLIISLDLPTIKNVKKGLDVLRSLNLLSRTVLVLNRSSGIAGIEAADVEKLLEMKIIASIPSDGKLVVSSINKGIPFVKLNQRANVSKGINDLFAFVERWKVKK